MDKPKKILHSLDKYVALGFDADHCLLRYKLANFFEVMYKTMAHILVEEKSYPQEMLEYGKKEKSFMMNGLIIDYKTAYLLKLGENKVITRAYYGHERVSQEDLEARYGSPPKYDILDPYRCNTESYMCGVSFFECFASSVLAHMIEHKKKIHHPEQIHVLDIIKDCGEAAEKAYEVYVEDSYSQVDRLIYKQDKLRDMLLNLKAKGKILFIATNAYPKYHDVFMTHAFGKDWKSIFDFIITSSGKPKFFSEQDIPCYEVDSNFEKIDRSVTELRQHQLYLGGNAKLLEENIARINAGKEGRVLFFGDHYSTDVLAAEKIDHWDGVCIMEELGGADFGEGYDESFWGHWQYEETPCGKIPTYWYTYMSQNVAMCTSLVDSIEMASFYEIEKS